MKTKLLFSIVALFWTSIVLSQTYHPMIKENRYWDVREGSNAHICNYHTGYRYFFGRDTLINNKSYKALNYHPFVEPNGFCNGFAVDTSVIYANNNLYFYEDSINQQVFAFSPYHFNPAECLYMDFSLGIGDTLPANSCYGQQIIDTIFNFTLLDGSTRRVMSISPSFPSVPHDLNGYIVEGIGTAQGFFYADLVGLGFWYKADCVIDDGIHIYGSYCNNPILNNKSIDTTSDIIYNIYPNPSQDYLHIHYQYPKSMTNLQFRITDLLGKTHKAMLQGISMDNLYTIPILELPSGTYVLEVFVDNKPQVSQQFIKQ